MNSLSSYLSSSLPEQRYKIKALVSSCFAQSNLCQDNFVQPKMSQEQPRRPLQEPVKYGDVFDVSGPLASTPVAPRDAAAMQAAENMALGQTQKGGPAAVMQSAASANERAGFIRHTTATNIPRDEGVTVTETVEDGNRVITEAIGDQV